MMNLILYKLCRSYAIGDVNHPFNLSTICKHNTSRLSSASSEIFGSDEPFNLVIKLLGQTNGPSVNVACPITTSRQHISEFDPWMS